VNVEAVAQVYSFTKASSTICTSFEKYVGAITIEITL
jgi:hypothetical protein